MRLRFCIFLFILTGALSFGQKVRTHQKTREVILNSGDSIFVANILLDEAKVETDLKKTYYWYIRGKICHNTGDFSGKLLDGRFQVFVQDKLILSGTYEKGIKTGRWISWKNDGSINNITMFKNGIAISDSISKAQSGVKKNRVKADPNKKLKLKLFQKKTNNTEPVQP
jgi:antitoxin component YwqK of YwqJK toxin-antitoxin module